MKIQLEKEQLNLFIKVLKDLKELNRYVPVLVEGKRDRETLRKLGLEGTILLLHQGLNLYEYSEELAERYDKIIILLDWDPRGEAMYQKIKGYLKGHYEEFSFIRETIKKLSGDQFYEVEHLIDIFKG